MIEALCWSLVAAAPNVELRSCEADLDEVFERRVALEWPDAPPDAKVTVSCATDRVELRLSAPGFVSRTEAVALPELSREGRGRLLALVTAERGRALVPARVPLVAVETLPPIESSRPAPAPEWTPLPGALVWLSESGERSLEWRLGGAGLVTTPLWLGPWRLGPRVAVSHGPVTIALSATFGRLNVDLGLLTPSLGRSTIVPILAQSLSLAPEFGLVGVRRRWWAVRLVARGLLGYGGVSGEGGAAVASSTVASFEVGGEAVLAFAVRLNSFLALEADTALGWVWGPYGTAAGQPVASLGGGVVSFGLGLSVSWGRR